MDVSGGSLENLDAGNHMPDLLPPRRQERQVRKINFFAAFASLREIFRVLVDGAAALGLRGRISV